MFLENRLRGWKKESFQQAANFRLTSEHLLAKHILEKLSDQRADCCQVTGRIVSVLLAQ